MHSTWVRLSKTSCTETSMIVTILNWQNWNENELNIFFSKIAEASPWRKQKSLIFQKVLHCKTATRSASQIVKERLDWTDFLQKNLTQLAIYLLEWKKYSWKSRAFGLPSEENFCIISYVASSEIIALLMSLEMSGKGPMKDVGSYLRSYYGLKLICNRAGLPALRVI